MSNTDRKRELLTFLFAKPKDQPALFNAIINKELVKMKEYMEERSNNDEFKIYNTQLDNIIYEGKLKGVEEQTKILKEQMEARINGTKHPSLISIIDRKLFIFEMQLDIGVYNFLNNKKKVKFYLDTA
jgi:hypothetical protein